MDCNNKVITVPIINTGSILQIHVSLNSECNAIEIDSWEQGKVESNEFIHNDDVDAMPEEVTKAITAHFDISLSGDDFPFLFMSSANYDAVKSQLM
ncbi:hypothetical protein ACQKQC_06160 [Vibrio fortis]|uniref:hypothetical protein n=1 Tax=Vibrio fortis TaxID=212667 RepID=UPI00406761AA